MDVAVDLCLRVCVCMCVCVGVCIPDVVWTRFTGLNNHVIDQLHSGYFSFNVIIIQIYSGVCNWSRYISE